MRIRKLIFTAAVISMAMSGTAFAGTWKMGTGENQAKWWYDFDNGTYAAEGWHWIDGNNDGVAECYCFDAEGWLLVSTTTPSGGVVNENGEWVKDGVVQTKTVEEIAQAEQIQKEAAQQSGIDLSWLRNEEGGINLERVYFDAEDWCEKNGIAYEVEKSLDHASYYAVSVEAWAQNSDRGALWKQLMDRYQMPCYLGNYITPTSGNWAAFDYTVALPAGITAAEIDGVVGTVELLLTIGGRYDGVLEVLNWVWNTDDNGIITVHFTGDVDLDKMVF